MDISTWFDRFNKILGCFVCVAFFCGCNTTDTISITDTGATSYAMEVDKTLSARSKVKLAVDVVKGEARESNTYYYKGETSEPELIEMDYSIQTSSMSALYRLLDKSFLKADLELGYGQVDVDARIYGDKVLSTSYEDGVFSAFSVKYPFSKTFNLEAYVSSILKAGTYGRGITLGADVNRFFEIRMGYFEKIKNFTADVEAGPLLSSGSGEIEMREYKVVTKSKGLRVEAKLHF